MKTALLGFALLSSGVLSSDLATAQEPRRASLVGGVGNSMGWFGASGELYFAGERASVFVGLGYTPALESGDPSGVTVAGGVRGYTKGRHHRAFLEASVSQIAIEQNGEGRFYGPGAQVGYQYTAGGGFTLLASIGVGFVVAADPPGNRAQPLIGLGLGYTWR